LGVKRLSIRLEGVAHKLLFGKLKIMGELSEANYLIWFSVQWDNLLSKKKERLYSWSKGSPFWSVTIAYKRHLTCTGRFRRLLKLLAKIVVL
jgi:hypothetical protein